MICAIHGCGKTSNTRGWCRMHYMRWYRDGDPLRPGRKVIKGDLALRLWARVDQSTEHWLWTGNKNRKGYGYLSRGSRADGKILAHVASWIVSRGPVPEGICVLHKCDIPACVNPSCLFLGTIADNNQDMTHKGRSANQKKTHCVHGHEFTSDNTLPNGRPWRRKCRTCKLEQQRRYRSRLTTTPPSSSSAPSPGT
jgi:HNH endonuclease